MISFSKQRRALTVSKAIGALAAVCALSFTLTAPAVAQNNGPDAELGEGVSAEVRSPVGASSQQGDLQADDQRGIQLDFTFVPTSPQCSASDTEGVKICVTPHAAKQEPAALNRGAGIRSFKTQPLPTALCMPTGQATVRVTRTESCTSLLMTVQIVRESKTGVTIVGTNEIVTYLYQYSSLRQATVANQLTILPSSFTGSGAETFVASATPACKGNCKLDGNVPSIAGRKLTPKSEISTESFYTWTGTKARTEQTMTWTISFANPQAGGNPQITAGPGVSYRCDNENGSASALPGCVVKQSAMQMTYAKSSWPGFGRHVSLAQGSGLPGAVVPLTRLDANQSPIANRNKACPTNLKRPSGMDCDEYPFASTKQGAALNGGTGRTFAGCGINDKRYAIGANGAKGFSACMISAAENRSAGAQMGAFWAKYHVLAGDNFYINVK